METAGPVILRIRSNLSRSGSAVHPQALDKVAETRRRDYTNAADKAVDYFWQNAENINPPGAGTIRALAPIDRATVALSPTELPHAPAIIRGPARAIAGRAGEITYDPSQWAFFLIPGGALGPAATRSLSLAYAGRSGLSAWRQANEIKGIWNSNIPQEQKYEAVTNLVLDSLMASVAAAHASFPTKETRLTRLDTTVADQLSRMPVADQQEIYSRLQAQIPTFNLPKPGDSVLIPDGHPGTVEKIFPRMGVARVQTESGPRTVKLSDIQGKDTSIPATPAQVHPNLEFPAPQLHPGDQIVLINGTYADVLDAFPKMGVASVRMPDGTERTARLSDLERLPTPQELAASPWPPYSAIRSPKTVPNASGRAILDSVNTFRVTNKGLAYDYQRSVCGDVEYEISGGGEKVRADGLDKPQGVAKDSKWVGKEDISPVVEDSGVDPDFRPMILDRLENEFRRYGAVINDPKSPIRALEVITNNPRAVPYFRGLMRRYNIPGRVVVVKK
ncbi:MAG TPA: restriction endonuclease fold toxin-2 domain-containing protein [Candidatus Angelobacter sp.]